ncbi:hypothetical protein PI95_013425 [Hassallia byssoidea VB512170]|uniref:Uncharacterized protein n=1 Tax=Hassallia byssoidea VB512170 TaxID=1304833 RepID=A0A846H995_9CYAN|nr:hypothetical protein [Hassalia byssoidea]NEU73538.1 hypothetical protein [Hassalia byssoidea VB512170]
MVVGGWWLVVSCLWLVVGGWWLVVGGWSLVVIPIICDVAFYSPQAGSLGLNELSHD